MSNIYSWLTDDPIGLIVFSLSRNIFSLILVFHIMQRWMLPRLFTVLNKGLGIHGRVTDTVWQAIEKGNIAVAIYSGLRVFGVLLFMGLLAAQFIK